MFKWSWRPAFKLVLSNYSESSVSISTPQLGGRGIYERV
jgi:hypothetical protein